jgi:branched-subunit amino acid ABC-type transport system permease component
MVEMYLGYPVFILQGVVSLIGTVVAGVLIGFFTTFYLKRKDETTRVAGVILGKRVEAQHQILNFLESSSQKLEMIR